MNRERLGTTRKKSALGRVPTVHKRPAWVESGEEELCPDCFKVVGERNRYRLVCMLGKEPEGLSVKELTEKLNIAQPTVTHHLQILRSVNAVVNTERGRMSIYRLNRDAHCFDECKIPY